MIDFQQFFLIILISTLTVLIVIFSIFVFKILQELRETLRKINKILDDMGTISSSVAQPVSNLGSLVEGLKSGMKVFEVIGSFMGKHAEDAEIAADEEDDDD